MAYGGLRGAIAFALVSEISGEEVGLKKNMFVSTTIAVVFWTCFVQGITIKPLVQYLEVKRASEKDPNMNERIAGKPPRAPNVKCHPAYRNRKGPRKDLNI